MKFEPYDYQKKAINAVIENKRYALFLQMGLGKTVCTLTAIKHLMDNFAIWRVLILAPKRVAEETWAQEAAKWDHLQDMDIHTVTGPPEARNLTLEGPPGVYVISYTLTQWITKKYGKKWPFDMVVIDELSGFKNPQAKRFRALKKVLPYSERVIGLTGTPTPNGLIDLWSQMYLIDGGETLGHTLTEYRQTYFHPGAHYGHIVYEWIPNKDAKKLITKKLRLRAITMETSDYLQLPDLINREIRVKVPVMKMQQYKALEREQIARLDDHVVAAPNAAAVMNKLLQMANGAVYDDQGEIIKIHTAKIDALKELIETATGPVLVYYNFRHDKEAIEAAIPEARGLDVAEWNAGNIPVMLVHPASVGYGLNLQAGGHTIIWYGLTWSLELYQQANARLHRQGQKEPVIIHHLIAEGTVDEQVMSALMNKNTSQAALMAALKERR